LRGDVGSLRKRAIASIFYNLIISLLLIG
jgi:hypothetical protein